MFIFLHNIPEFLVNLLIPGASDLLFAVIAAVLSFSLELTCSFICLLFIEHAEKTAPRSSSRNIQISQVDAGIPLDMERSRVGIPAPGLQGAGQSGWYSATLPGPSFPPYCCWNRDFISLMK